MLANIGAVLDDCGASWADVARATIFLTDLGNFATVNALYEGAIGAHRPARTTIGVAALPAGARSGDRMLGVPAPRRRCESTSEHHEQSTRMTTEIEKTEASGGRS